MGSPAGPDTPARLFRRHIAEMRKYADELAAVLGKKSPIVKRIRSCSDECADALTRIEQCQQRERAAQIARDVQTPSSDTSMREE